MGNQIRETRVICRAVSLDEHDGIRTIKGSAVVYDSPSYELTERGKTFTEYVRRGAFSNLDGADVFACLDHNSEKYLGRTINNTLRLHDTDESLDFELDLPNTSAGDETYEYVKRGDLPGVSFTANVLNEVWNEDNTVCELIELHLTEISPVFDPAYADTNIVLRSLARAKNKPKPRFGRLEYAKLIIAIEESE